MPQPRAEQAPGGTLWMRAGCSLSSVRSPNCSRKPRNAHLYVPREPVNLVRLFAIPWTIAYQAPPSMEFSRQEYWSGLPFPSPGHLPDPGIKLRSPELQADASPSEPPGNSRFWYVVANGTLSENPEWTSIMGPAHTCGPAGSLQAPPLPQTQGQKVPPCSGQLSPAEALLHGPVSG